MSNQLTPFRNRALSTSSQAAKPSWGSANPLRGAKFNDIAVKFLAEFPVGTVLAQEKFCEWAQRNELLDTPKDVSKQSDTWLAHLQRRHQLRHNLNKAACHPRMTEQGLTPFAVESVAPDVLEVRGVQTAIAKSSVTRQVANLVKTKHRQLAYLMQSADWSALPPHERAIAETLYDDITAYREDIETGSTRLTNKFLKLEHRLKDLGVTMPEPAASLEGPATDVNDDE